MSKKFHGGVLMDMVHTSSIPRLFDLKTMLNKQIKIKNKEGLIISINSQSILRKENIMEFLNLGEHIKIK